jgi:hypothetical protein
MCVQRNFQIQTPIDFTRSTWSQFGNLRGGTNMISLMGLISSGAPFPAHRTTSKSSTFGISPFESVPTSWRRHWESVVSWSHEEGSFHSSSLGVIGEAGLPTTLATMYSLSSFSNRRIAISNQRCCGFHVTGSSGPCLAIEKLTIECARWRPAVYDSLLFSFWSHYFAILIDSIQRTHPRCWLIVIKRFYHQIMWFLWLGRPKIFPFWDSVVDPYCFCGTVTISIMSSTLWSSIISVK